MLLLFRAHLPLITLSTLLVGVSFVGLSPAAAALQDTKPQETKPQEAKPQAQEAKPQEAKPTDAKVPQDVKFTAEQIVESVILVYGTRPALEQDRKSTRLNS